MHVTYRDSDRVLAFAMDAVGLASGCSVGWFRRRFFSVSYITSSTAQRFRNSDEPAALGDEFDSVGDHLLCRPDTNRMALSANRSWNSKTAKEIRKSLD